MLFGYARVSRKSQNLETQKEVLEKLGCERFFFEKRSGSKNRAEFNRIQEQVREGDVICVTEISRLGRTALQLIQLFNDFSKKNIHFVSHRQGIDTRTPTGKFLFYLFSILAENEIDQVDDRTDEARKAARERGKKGGRPPGLTEKAQKTADMVLILYQQKQSIADIRKALKIGSNTTLYNYLEDARRRAAASKENLPA